MQIEITHGTRQSSNAKPVRNGTSPRRSSEYVPHPGNATNRSISPDGVSNTIHSRTSSSFEQSAQHVDTQWGEHALAWQERLRVLYVFGALL
jgi:hypothetical protein